MSDGPTLRPQRMLNNAQRAHKVHNEALVELRRAVR